MSSTKKIPPDGGYGWVIVFSSALSSFITVSLVQVFGLIFKDFFAEIGFSATESSLIVNVNGAFGKMVGPITGVLLKLYGCRIVGLVAAFLLTVGMVMTSYSKSFAAFFVTYGLIASLGMQVSESTQRLAMNLYFKTKRGVAMGYAQTAAAFGPILIPQLIRFLMKIYDTQEVSMIYAGICANAFVSSMLLQPVEWHMKEDPAAKETLIEDKPNHIEEKKEETMWNTIVKIFDLDLLKDPIFLNILAGMSLSFFAELNFTLLIPFILGDFGLNTDEIATFLTTLGIADIIFRFIGPHIGNYFTKPSRVMYAYALVLLVGVRFTLLLTSNYYVLLGIALALGVAKGVRKVYMYLVIPDYVPMEKLPNAGGIETLANGICVIIGGSVLGVLRDVTGSYVICIVVMNLVTLFTIVIWVIEVIIVKYRNRSRRDKLSANISE